MYDQKSVYALNKKDIDAIVCPDVTGKPHRLTRADFDSEEDFMFWKNWSDRDYQLQDNAETTEKRYTVALSVLPETGTMSANPEEAMIKLQTQLETDKVNTDLISQIRSLVTERQYRRLWLFHGKQMKQEQIADIESAHQQNISVSIAAAKKKIKKFINNPGK